MRQRKDGPVVQLVRTLACHARGRGFEPHPGRHLAAIAQSVERILGKDEVSSSNLLSSSMVKALQTFRLKGFLLPAKHVVALWIPFVLYCARAYLKTKKCTKDCYVLY